MPARLTFVPFLPDGNCALIRTGDGGLDLPAGEVRPGEHEVLDATLRILLDTAGFRFQRFHALDRAAGHTWAWVEGDRYRGRRPHNPVPLEIVPPGEASRLLAAGGRPDLAGLVERAARSARDLTDDQYYAEAVELLEPAYLRATTAEGGSGFGGTPEEWRAAREPITEGIEHHGAFLDVGCANGLLMESVQAWRAEWGIDVEPYGVDLSPALAELARHRLPHWADRIWVGNAIDWVHPGRRRFDYVHIGLGAVPRHRRADLVAHHLARVVADGGRLLVSHYLAPGTDHDETPASFLAANGFAVSDESSLAHTAWVDRP